MAEEEGDMGGEGLAEFDPLDGGTTILRELLMATAAATAPP